MNLVTREQIGAFLNTPRGRLITWIDFVGSLPRPKFRFSTWKYDNATKKEDGARQPSLHVCTTSACAAGWLPVLWPEFWHWRGAAPFLRTRTGDNIWDDTVVDVASFFLIPNWQAEHLVIPGAYMNAGVTPRQWAREARSIIRLPK